MDGNPHEALMSEGFDFELACRYVNPRYAGWDPTARRAYALYLKSKLVERKNERKEKS